MLSDRRNIIGVSLGLFFDPGGRPRPRLISAVESILKYYQNIAMLIIVIND